MSKTIKIIDLLNKIANGEEVPELIEYNKENYIFQNTDYKNEDRDLYLFSEETPDITAVLNDTVKIVEIIEEQQDIDIQGLAEIPGLIHALSSDGIGENIDILVNQCNYLTQAVKQLDNKIKEISNGK